MKGLIVIFVLVGVMVSSGHTYKKWNLKKLLYSGVWQAEQDVQSSGGRITAAPGSWDWRSRGVVPPVHNQGQQGLPVAFAATAAVASLQAIRSGRLLELSVQEMAGCCASPMEPAPRDVFDCVHNIGGLCSASSYPPHPSSKCANSSCQAQAQVRGGRVVPAGDEGALQAAVLTSGPVLVLVDASKTSFQEYRAGVYEDPDCSTTRLDHALLVVGYGMEGSTPFWICQNSWGAAWGENGYVRIKRGSNMCGIATYASYPY